jgi:hypothetical protein
LYTLTRQEYKDNINVKNIREKLCRIRNRIRIRNQLKSRIRIRKNHSGSTTLIKTKPAEQREVEHDTHVEYLVLHLEGAVGFVIGEGRGAGEQNVQDDPQGPAVNLTLAKVEIKTLFADLNAVTKLPPSYYTSEPPDLY